MKPSAICVAILIACGTLVSVSVLASSSNEDDKINALAKQAIELRNESNHLTLRLEEIETLTTDVEIYGVMSPKAAVREAKKLSEELSELASDYDDFVDAFQEAANEANTVLPLLQKMREGGVADPQIAKGSEAFDILHDVSSVIDNELYPGIMDAGSKLRTTIRSFEMRERLKREWELPD